MSCEGNVSLSISQKTIMDIAKNMHMSLFECRGKSGRKQKLLGPYKRRVTPPLVAPLGSIFSENPPNALQSILSHWIKFMFSLDRGYASYID
jgi:hypothetical protein